MPVVSLFFFFNDPATTEIYTLSLHDALPISHRVPQHRRLARPGAGSVTGAWSPIHRWPSRYATTASEPNADRKSTRLNSSHTVISYAVFCLKKKKKTTKKTKKKII